MAKLNVVTKQVRMELFDIIKFQLITHCYINHIALSELDYECLTYLGISGEIEQADFCFQIAEKRLSQKLKDNQNKTKLPEASSQAIRNVLIKVEKAGLLVKTGKEGKSRKKIYLNPDLQIQTRGNILLNQKIVYVESQES